MSEVEGFRFLAETRQVLVSAERLNPVLTQSPEEADDAERSRIAIQKRFGHE